MPPHAQVPVKAKIAVPKRDLPPPEGANWFHFSQANTDVQVMIGYIDPSQAGDYVTAIRAGKKPEHDLVPMVTRRVLLSLSGFLSLRQQVEQMFGKMREAGVLDVEEAGSESGKNDV